VFGTACLVFKEIKFCLGAQFPDIGFKTEVAVLLRSRTRSGVISLNVSNIEVCLHSKAWIYIVTKNCPDRGLSKRTEMACRIEISYIIGTSDK
jgi:hypothetical protein